MTSGLGGRVAIVTGAASGIGAATARALAEEGAFVFLTDVADDAGLTQARLLHDAGGRASFMHHDVSAEEDWHGVVARAIEERGRLDVLVNNAGVFGLHDVEGETRERWDRVIAINQTGVFLGMRAVVPALRRTGGGAIVNISSIFGAVGGFGAMHAYHASKGAVRAMTKNAAIRFAKQGIRVNSIHPAFVETPMLAVGKAPGLVDQLVAQTPMGRLGQPEEVARAVVFLAGDDASYVTGAELYVDGGWTAQ